MQISFLLPDCVIRVSGQDNQQQRTRVVSWVTKYKQY